jgi:hypothetical protein
LYEGKVIVASPLSKFGGDIQSQMARSNPSSLVARVELERLKTLTALTIRLGEIDAVSMTAEDFLGWLTVL